MYNQPEFLYLSKETGLSSACIKSTTDGSGATKLRVTRQHSCIISCHISCLAELEMDATWIDSKLEKSPRTMEIRI